MATTRRPQNIILAVAALLTFTLIMFRTGSAVRNGPLSLTDKGSAVPEQKLLGHINNSTLGFEKIFVVGLPRRTDRRDTMILAASLSNIEIEFIDGVSGDAVPDNAIPSAQGQERLPSPNVGSWRGHMNAIQEIVRRNLSSALILEDDADWDINLRNQLEAFALSSQALTQPLRGTESSYADPAFPGPGPANRTVVRPADLLYDQLPLTEEPVKSPYGDNWDALWLGHCGMHFPFEKNTVIPKGRVVQTDPTTVPQQQHLWTLSEPNDLKVQYPNHTRVVHHSQEGICSLGYAVSRQGARQMLYEIGLKNVTAPFDILLRWYCEGDGGRRYHTCLTSQPGLFQHHRRSGPNSAHSDISDHNGGYRGKAYTDVVRWSVVLNAEGIMAGEPLVDQFPDVDWVGEAVVVTEE